MLKGVVAVLAGLISGVAVVFAVESGGHLLYPPPEVVDLNNPEALRTFMQSIPLGAKIAVLVAWGLGTMTGSAVAIFASGRQSWPAWVVASVLFGLALSTMVLIPHPDWMVIGATFITLASAISAAYLWATS